MRTFPIGCWIALLIMLLLIVLVPLLLLYLYIEGFQYMMMDVYENTYCNDSIPVDTIMYKYK